MTKMMYRGHEVKAANDNMNAANQAVDLIYRGTHFNPNEKAVKNDTHARNSRLFYRGAHVA